MAMEESCKMHHDMFAGRIPFDFRQKIATLCFYASKKVGTNACHGGSSEISADVRLDPRAPIAENVAGSSLSCILTTALGQLKKPGSKEREANAGERGLMRIICAINHTLKRQGARFGPRKTYDG